MRETYESTLWEYMQTTVLQSVEDYQVQKELPMLLSAPPFSQKELGYLLLKAIEGKTPAEVL